VRGAHDLDADEEREQRERGEEDAHGLPHPAGRQRVEQAHGGAVGGDSYSGNGNGTGGNGGGNTGGTSTGGNGGGNTGGTSTGGTSTGGTSSSGSGTTSSCGGSGTTIVTCPAGYKLNLSNCTCKKSK
jgi:hypothetical protein